MQLLTLIDEPITSQNLNMRPSTAYLVEDQMVGKRDKKKRG